MINVGKSTSVTCTIHGIATVVEHRTVSRGARVTYFTELVHHDEHDKGTTKKAMHAPVPSEPVPVTARFRTSLSVPRGCHWFGRPHYFYCLDKLAYYPRSCDDSYSDALVRPHWCTGTSTTDTLVRAVEVRLMDVLYGV